MGVIHLHQSYFDTELEHEDAEALRGMRRRQAETEQKRASALPPIYIPFSERVTEYIDELRRLVARKERIRRLKATASLELIRLLDIPAPTATTSERGKYVIDTAKRAVLEAFERVIVRDVLPADEERYETALVATDLIRKVEEAAREEQSLSDEADAVLFALGSIGAFDILRSRAMLELVSDTRLGPLKETIVKELRLALVCERGNGCEKALEHFRLVAEAMAELRLGVMLRNAFIERLVSDTYEVEDFHERRARYVRRLDEISVRMNELAPKSESGAITDAERSEWDDLSTELKSLADEFGGVAHRHDP